MKPEDAVEFATGRGSEELKARMKLLGKDKSVGETATAVFDKFFADQGIMFTGRDDKKILDSLK